MTPSPEVVEAITVAARDQVLGSLNYRERNITIAAAEVAQRLINEAVAEQAMEYQVGDGYQKGWDHGAATAAKYRAEARAAQAATPVAISEALEGMAAELVALAAVDPFDDQFKGLCAASEFVRQAAEEYKP